MSIDDALHIAVMFLAAVSGLFTLAYLVNLLVAVARGDGVAFGDVLVRCVFGAAFGAVTLALLWLGGVL